MKIREKLSLGFGLVSLTALGIGVVSVMSVNTVNTRALELYDQALMVGNFSQSAATHFFKLDGLYHQAAAMEEDAREDHLELIADETEVFFEDLEVVKERSVDPRIHEILPMVNDHFQQWKTQQDNWLSTISENASSSSENAGQSNFSEEVAKTRVQVEEDLINIVDFATESGFTMRVESEEQGEVLLMITIATTAGSLFIAGLVVWFISRPIVRRLNRMIGAVDQFANGDFSEASNVAVHDEIANLSNHSDEIGQLGEAFKKMAEQIEGHIAQGREFQGKIEAISKAQAIIEFQMDGTILTANENFCQTMGYTLDEIKGQHHRLFVDSVEANSPAYQAFWAKLNRGEYDAGVYRTVGKGGKDAWIQASYTPILDASDKPYKVVKFATDITEQKTAQNEVERLIEAAAKGQLEERIATEQFEGASKDLTEGFNRLLTAIESPLKEARTVLSAVAEGDLSHQMTGQYEGQFGEIKSSLNIAIVNLTGIVQSVREAAGCVSTASEEITQGNVDLSGRTSAQAGALEETSASMEEMTSTIKQNADNAKQANELAVAAREVAEKGGAVTEKAVEAMAEINKSSKKIADIINVIDEIAFQTNLLALNAAVEAARAGEQGRGFAVVASEVRNLAQRSASAAKEIKGLINESVEKVGDGSQLVNQSGQTLEEIVNSVQRVTDIIAEISAASQEQASGIDQVNKAVMQMDQGTQQNVALVEQATSSSQSMKEQAAALLDQVAFFKLEEEGAGQSSQRTTGKKHETVPRPSSAKPAGRPSKSQSPVKSSAPQSVGVGTSNGHGRLQDGEDFFEQF